VEIMMRISKMNKTRMEKKRMIMMRKMMIM
jgi:hypothetical protein